MEEAANARRLDGCGHGSYGVACCALPQVMLVAAGGLALGILLGWGVALVAMAAVVVVLVVRRKRAPSPQGDQG